KALLEAAEYCDDWRNREEVLQMICKPEYVGSAAEYTRPGFIDPYDWGTEAKPDLLLKYNEFYVDKTNCPNRVEALWIIAQMARWGIAPFPKNWFEVIDRSRRVDVYSEASRQLGLPGLEPERESIKLFDGTQFSPDNPLDYLNSLEIKREITVEEIDLDQVGVKGPSPVQQSV
ncbi:MAG: bacitracin ABC transporter ATP-binding protein, partial [Okeania sp. SIO2D1]|nr:bacitracin ABC transporter ATP-binding protein [Okeania sp. SIO2D1]